MQTKLVCFCDSDGRSGYQCLLRPFLGIILQGGKPGKHTLLASILVLFNIVGNILLIPILGMYGAALVTALVFILEAVLIKEFARKLFGIKL
ncbi:MAG: hypothetical protein D4R45_01165 [Planctomycetaceae bacterium]|nr:MAG: hypothetical protein D4R45_01165 [Planctomycetaceae bacterium]